MNLPLLMAFTLSLAAIAGPKAAPVLGAWKHRPLEGLIQEPREQMGYSPHYVMAFAFSPDGKRVAVLAGQHNHGQQYLAHLLILNVDNLEKAERQVDVISSRQIFASAFRWTRNPQLLFLQSSDRVRLIEPNTGATRCESQGTRPDAWYDMPGGPIGQNMYVVGKTADLGRKNGILWFYDFDCKLLQELPANARAYSGDTSPTASLLAMVDEREKIVVYKPKDSQIAIFADNRVQLQIAFLRSGILLCSGTLPGPGDGSLRCWSVDRPAKMHSSYEMKKGGTKPFATSSDASIVMLPERTFTYNPFTENQKSHVKRYVIWDAQTERTVATIATRMQWAALNFDSHPRKLEESLVFSVSPDGKIIALAAQDAIEIFMVAQ